MTAAQIAKMEAKRAAKAAKAAAKGAAKKEKKKAAGLGVGTAELRQLVAPSGPDAAAVGAEEIKAKLDPFRTGEVRRVTDGCFSCHDGDLMRVGALVCWCW